MIRTIDICFMIDKCIILVEFACNWFNATCDFNMKVHFPK